jgi:hypothetical protein
MNYYLSKLIQNTIAALQEADCCVVNENDSQFSAFLTFP